MSLSSVLVSGSSFLDLSIHHPNLFDTETDFVLDNGVHVSVWAPGIIIFTPREVVERHLILSCGIHGNETAPIELCERWVAALLTGNITPRRRCMFIFGNLAAINTQTRFVDENLNRLFRANDKGSAPSSLEGIRASTIMGCVDRFFNGTNSQAERRHYDLHTAIRDSKYEKFAVFPYLGKGRARELAQLTILKKMGILTVLLSDRPTGTFSYYSSAVHDAQAFTIELGKVRPFGENDLSTFDQVEKAIIDLIQDCGESEHNLTVKDFNLFKVKQTIIKTDESFKLDFADDIANFTTFEKGARLAFQNNVEFKAMCDDEAVVFPNSNVAVGQRAILTVIKSGLNDDNE